MGKKKKALLRYKRLGTISKKLEKKFANFLQANVEKFNTKVEETLEKVDILLDKTEEIINTTKAPVSDEIVKEDVKVEEVKATTKGKPAVKKPPTTKKTSKTTPKKTTSTTRRRRTIKTKQDS
jgi:hypothetical protein